MHAWYKRTLTSLKEHKKWQLFQFDKRSAAFQVGRCAELSRRQEQFGKSMNLPSEFEQAVKYVCLVWKKIWNWVWNCVFPSCIYKEYKPVDTAIYKAPLWAVTINIFRISSCRIKWRQDKKILPIKFTYVNQRFRKSKQTIESKALRSIFPKAIEKSFYWWIIFFLGQHSAGDFPSGYFYYGL